MTKTSTTDLYAEPGEIPVAERMPPLKEMVRTMVGGLLRWLRWNGAEWQEPHGQRHGVDWYERWETTRDPVPDYWIPNKESK